MATQFNVGSFFARWLFALVLVMGTYNPTDYSYVHWVTSNTADFGPVMALVGLLVLICWVIFLRASFQSLGVIGLALWAAVFACIIWLLIDQGLLSLESTGAITWIILVILSLTLATGMSWSHIRRRLTGQVDVDDVDD